MKAQGKFLVPCNYTAFINLNIIPLYSDLTMLWKYNLSDFCIIKQYFSISASVFQRFSFKHILLFPILIIIMILASSFASTMQIGFWTRVRVRVILLGGKMAHRPSVELTVQIGTPTCHFVLQRITGGKHRRKHHSFSTGKLAPLGPWGSLTNRGGLERHAEDRM